MSWTSFATRTEINKMLLVFLDRKDIMSKTVTLLVLVNVVVVFTFKGLVTLLINYYTFFFQNKEIVLLFLHFLSSANIQV